MRKNCDKKATKKPKKTKREIQPNEIEMAEEKQPLENLEKKTLDDRPYKEMYFDNYAEKEGGDQMYGIKRNRDQYYKMNEDNTEEVFAKKLKGDKMEEFYAQTEDRVEFLPKKKIGDTWVSSNYRQDGNSKYIYPFNNVSNKEEYEYEANGDPRLALDQNNEPYYPSERDPLTDEFIQYIPTRRDGERFYIMSDGKQVYPKNVTRNIFVYPKDNDGNEYYLKDENNEDYYIKNGDNEIYANAKFGKFRTNILAVRNNTPTYAKINNEQKEIYPFDEEFQKEYYVTDGKQQLIWALDENNKPYYPSYKKPLTQEWIQYIPIIENIQKIITENGKQIYPKNITQNVYVYPKDNDDDEYYLENEQNEEYYIENETDKQIYASYKSGENKLIYRNGEPIYARDGKKEKYPVYGPGKSQFYKIMNSIERGALLNTEQPGYYYAKDEKKDEFYPKDFSLPEDVNSVVDPSSTSVTEYDEETSSESENDDTNEKPGEGNDAKPKVEESDKKEDKVIPPPPAIDYNKLNSLGLD